jgi:YggT family protein
MAFVAPPRGAADYGDRAAACQAGLLSKHGPHLAEPVGGRYGLRAIGRRIFCQMYAFLELVSTVISIYIWLLIAQAVLSWLVAFGVVNRYNRAVATIGDFLWRVTEPLLRPIRRILPDLGGIDISPVILILLLWFVRNLMFEYLA